jgi:GxxExxY protein
VAYGWAITEVMATLTVNRNTAQEISHAVITAAMRVHSELGPGLLESTYTACLQHELGKAGFKSDAQVGLPVVYDGVRLDLGYRIDLLVEDLVIVELKSVEAIAPVHQAQIIILPETEWTIPRTSHKLQCCSLERRHQAFRKWHRVEVNS